MKRIVELSENDYKALKEDGVHNHLALADEIIAHSEPYEEKPQGDLISREALKAYAREVLCGENATNISLLKMFDEIIDNAPTVDKGYDFGYADGHGEGYELGKNSRPHGEWIPVSERLPEENGEYLVTREAYIDRENRNMVIVRDISYFTTNYGLNNGFHKANTVIAWQPLPEPYQEAADE
jgi:hypothetical protein